ncbi:MAG: Gfo/Idh/MocA family oxidoreductase [Puniceicoccales bacterium]|nr:Gfo/Idh/MocA family oxidoreductase [Puniceicoccales bacterium]
MSRRRFLQNAGMALAAGIAFPAVIPARALGRDGEVAPSNRIALGVIGLQQGWNDGFVGSLNQRGVQGVAICDVDGERVQNKLRELQKRDNGKGAVGYKDFREMFAKANLDAVVIGAPDHWHGIMGVTAARAGLDIYGEKPLAHTLAEGRAIVSAVKQHGRVWQTGSWQRSRGNFYRAIELVRNGRIGKLARIEVGTHGGWGNKGGKPLPATYGKPPAHLDYDLYVGPAQWHEYDPRVVHYNWRWTLHFGGGNLMDWVGHHVDIAHWGAGKDDTGPVKIEPIEADFSTDAPFDAERTYHYKCTYADGLVIEVNSASGTKFIGEDGRWLYVNRSGRRGNGLDASDPAILKEVIGPEEYHPYKSDSHHANFIDCIRTRRTTITPAETAHRSASVGHLGHISLITGRTIHWDPVTETIKDDPAASKLLAPSYRSPWVL